MFNRTKQSIKLKSIENQKFLKVLSNTAKVICAIIDGTTIRVNSPFIDNRFVDLAMTVYLSHKLNIISCHFSVQSDRNMTVL